MKLAIDKSDSRCYLCRVFKKETGQSPAQWRALAGQTARPLSPAESQREQALYI